MDANGTLVRLVDPIPKLDRALRTREIERPPEAIARAFVIEGEHYRPRSLRGRDELSLAELRCECVGVFLDALDAELAVDEFVHAYLGCLDFELVPGAPEALERVAAAGVRLGVVANWDITLPETLRRLGVDRLFTTIVTSAEAGAAKPDPAIFRLALDRLAAAPERTLHVGNESVDEEGAQAAGMKFAPAPVTAALAAWT